jgi:hypothetical protein
MLENLKSAIINIYMTIPIVERNSFVSNLIEFLQNLDKQLYETVDEFQEKHDKHLKKKDK